MLRYECHSHTACVVVVVVLVGTGIKAQSLIPLVTVNMEYAHVAKEKGGGGGENTVPAIVKNTKILKR